MSKLLAKPSRGSNHHLMDRIKLVKGDLVAQTGVDALVSTIRTDMLMEGSLNQALLKQAGARLDEFLLEHIYKPRAGDVFAVPGFSLVAKHVIYVVMPMVDPGIDHEDRDLLRCYRHALELARRMKLTSIAFPVLGTGRDKYPVNRAVRLAVQGIMDRMCDGFAEIRIVCNRDETYRAFAERLRQPSQ